MMEKDRIESDDIDEILDVIRRKGNKMDKLRFAIMFLLSSKTIPSVEVESALREAEVDNSAFLYVKKIKSSGVNQLKLTTTVEALMDGKMNQEVESYLMFDQKSNLATISSSHERRTIQRSYCVYDWWWKLRGM